MTVANPLSEAEEAKKIVDRFVCRFDKSYELLVYHAAIPLIVTPELLNYLRHQFLRGEVDWVAEVDLLLSDLFNPVGYELYAMDTAVRAYLLENIEEFFQRQKFEKKHLQKVALLLLGYIKYLARTNFSFDAPELQAQQWGAMVYIEEQKEKVEQDIEQALKTCISEPELTRLRQIIQKLAPQLSSYPSLIKSAESVRDLLLLKLGLTEAVTVTVDRKGKIIKRETHSVKYFGEDLGNDITLEMVAIPGETFTMGSPAGEGDNDEKPQHQVTVPPFYMGKYPITQAQWQAIASRADLKVKQDLEPKPADFKDRPESDRRPVEQVSWYDVIEFCGRLSKLTGREYRLPSEAEWEYACRAGTTTPFYFGKTITGELANYNAGYTYADEPKGEYREQTTPVGQFPPNAFGLYDMHGNVWEWCLDPWHKSYQDKTRTDSEVWDEEQSEEQYLLNKNNVIQLLSDKRTRVIRGGSWSNYPRDCRGATRRRPLPGSRYDNCGFRVVCRFPRT